MHTETEKQIKTNRENQGQSLRRNQSWLFDM